MTNRESIHPRGLRSALGRLGEGRALLLLLVVGTAVSFVTGGGQTRDVEAAVDSIIQSAYEFRAKGEFSLAISRYRLAIAEIDKASDPEPFLETKSQTHWAIADCYFQMGDKDSARATFVDFFRFRPDFDQDPTFISPGLLIIFGEARAEFRILAEKAGPSPSGGKKSRDGFQEGALVSLFEVDVQPAPLEIVPAEYPSLVRRLGLTGNVTVNALISEDGTVLETAILKGISSIEPEYQYLFNKSAMEAVRRWTFTPAVKAGVPVKVWMPFNIVFRR